MIKFTHHTSETLILRNEHLSAEKRILAICSF